MMYIIGALLMNKFIKGEKGENEILLEIPPYRRPRFGAVAKKFGLFGLPKEAILTLIVGFVRKDLAVGTLIPLVATGVMDGRQLVIASVILMIYFPCYATFVVMLRELGIRDVMKSVGIMLGTVLLVGTVLRLGLLGF